jgi:hypothetical protein
VAILSLKLRGDDPELDIIGLRKIQAITQRKGRCAGGGFQTHPEHGVRVNFFLRFIKPLR